ncbi:MAG TPA: AI-2E family transporter, partial [Gammaproteobacteria bacterium]|nr:AI-2E family transporter [Gammaproteobacteria bacterium]
MNDAKKAIIFLSTLISLIILGWLILKLTPVLMPFLLAVGIAYLADPLVEKLTTIPRIPRTLAVSFVFTVILFLFLMFLLFVVPILNRETVEFVKIIPQVFLRLQEIILPRVEEFTGLSLANYDIQSFQETLMKHWTKATNFMTWLGQWLFHSGMTILHWGINSILIIVVTFYLLRDWHKMLHSLKYLIPISYRHQVLVLIKKSDTVMGTFLRGQLSVMLVLSVIYAIGLTLIGVPFSVLLGIISGLLSIVPYFGSIIGFLSTVIISLVQNQEGWNLIWIAIVFGIG